MYKQGTNQHKKVRKGWTMWEKILWTVVIIGSIILLLVTHKKESLDPHVEGYYQTVYASDLEDKVPTTDMIVSYITKVFGKSGKHVAVQAIRCFYSESGLRTEAYNKNTNGSEDRGVAQINSIHGMKPADAHDYKKNIDKAYQIYLRRGWKPWYGKDCNF